MLNVAMLSVVMLSVVEPNEVLCIMLLDSTFHFYAEFVKLNIVMLNVIIL
jgi:hypothetical protein